MHAVNIHRKFFSRQIYVKYNCHCLYWTFFCLQVLLDSKEISGDQIEFIINNYPVETPVKLVLDEKNPGSLPLFKLNEDCDLALSPLVPLKESVE